jgi:non-ribosomal peptide synthetase component E (peptide arylation enzyme)
LDAQHPDLGSIIKEHIDSRIPDPMGNERGLAEFKLPDVVQIVDDLPRTMVGKTDKGALRKSFRAL